MTATTLPNVGIQYKWALSEDGWNTGMDSNLLAADSLIQCSVISAAITTPPVSPSEGDRYIPYTGATGAWSSLVGKLVVYANAAWVSYTPKEGWLVYDNNTNGYLKYDGAAWVADALGDRAYADNLVTGLWNDRGNFDATGGTYPSSGGSGSAGAIKKGDIWTISVAGTLPTAQVVEVGDTVRALTNTPGNTQANWAIGQNNIGYVPESSSNKSTDSALGSSDILYPSQKAVRDYVSQSLPSPSNTINRGAKFGNHVYLSTTIPNCPYLGYGSGSQPIQPVDLVDALTNRGNIADSLLWEMSSNTIDTNTGVRLFTFATGAIYPQQRWVTGAKMQFLASLALATVIPTTENFVYRIGLSNVTASDISALNPFAGRSSVAGSEYTGCAAFFQADNTTGYWQCKSGQKASTQTTNTSVPYVLGQFAVFHVVVTTTGAVEFRINGTLVATHSGAGVIPNGAWLGESVGIRNLAATTTANKGFHLDEFQFRLTLPSARTGFAFS